MIHSLSGRSRDEVERTLAEVAARVLPQPFPETEFQEFDQQLLTEIKKIIGLPPADQSRKALSRIYAYLYKEITSESLSSQRASDARGRLGRRGELPPGDYNIEFKPWFKYHEEKLGIRKSAVENAMRHPDQVEHLSHEHLKARGFAPLSIYAKSRLEEADHFTLLVVSSRQEAKQTIFGAWRVYHADVDLRGSITPLQMLHAFFDRYGQEFTVGDSAPQKLILDEVYPLPDWYGAGSPDMDLFRVYGLASAGNAGFTRGYSRVNPLGVIEVAIAVTLNMTKYARDLRRHGVKTS